MVGVDGSDNARQALKWALREARERGGMVKAVTAWRSDSATAAAGNGRAEEQQCAERLLKHEMRSLPRDLTAGVPLALEAVEGRPAEVLVAASRGADLLVLGSHGHSRELHRVLGSVTDDCVRNAICPVVVLPIRYATHPVPNVTGASSGGSPYAARWTGDPVHPYVLPASRPVSRVN